MKCPVCTSVDLLMTERQGVEIDYCPQCRGVWLDRGELDKIIERSMNEAPRQSHRPQLLEHYEHKNHKKTAATTMTITGGITAIEGENHGLERYWISIDISAAYARVIPAMCRN